VKHSILSFPRAPSNSSTLYSFPWVESALSNSITGGKLEESCIQWLKVLGLIEENGYEARKSSPLYVFV